jgi:DNA-binding GntR family transcriptional regulator
LGNVRGGERLSPDEQAKKFGTSVTPVREALHKLSRDGLVEKRPNSGFFVTSVSLKRLRAMLEVREILEVAAVGLAASRITEQEFQELERLHAGYTGDDYESRVRYVSENRAFHYRIALASGNEELAEMIGQLHDRLMRFTVFVHPLQEILLRHNRLLDALRDHDVALAREVMVAEVRETRDITLVHVIDGQGAHWHVEAGALDRAPPSSLPEHRSLHDIRTHRMAPKRAQPQRRTRQCRPNVRRTRMSSVYPQLGHRS